MTRSLCVNELRRHHKGPEDTKVLKTKPCDLGALVVNAVALRN